MYMYEPAVYVNISPFPPSPPETTPVVISVSDRIEPYTGKQKILSLTLLEPLTSTSCDEDQEHSSGSIYEPAGQHFDYHGGSLV